MNGIFPTGFVARLLLCSALLCFALLAYLYLLAYILLAGRQCEPLPRWLGGCSCIQGAIILGLPLPYIHSSALCDSLTFMAAPHWAARALAA